MILEFRDLWSLGTCFLEILQCVAYCLFASDPCRKNSFCTFQISAWRMTDQEMQRGRDREAFLIHFTRIHRLAWPGTTRSLTQSKMSLYSARPVCGFKWSLTAMLLCMIAPGLDSSITVQSLSSFFHLKHPSLIRNGHIRACQEPFWQREIHKLLELLVPAPLACCQGLTSMPHYAFPVNVCMSQNYSMSQVYTVCEYWNATYACLL